MGSMFIMVMVMGVVMFRGVVVGVIGIFIFVVGGFGFFISGFGFVSELDRNFVF